MGIAVQGGSVQALMDEAARVASEPRLTILKATSLYYLGRKSR